MSIPTRIVASAILCMIATTTIAHGAVDDFLPPEKVSVLPVFLVPAGESMPDDDQADRLMRHLDWAREWLRDALRNRDSFTLAQEEPDVVPLDRPLAFYRSLPNGESACSWVAELLTHYQVSRFRCPWVFCCIVMNSHDDWPRGGGRTINGGFNRGGGFLQISSINLDESPNFQSTLRHELCHTFGLPHVDVYGYDMRRNPSVMAYNPAHHTNGFREARVPGRLIPEDLRGLSLNPLALPELQFDASRDLPGSYTLHPRVVSLGPMELPGRPDYEPQLTTTSGADLGTDPQNLHKEILPSAGPGVTFRRGVMWESGKQPDRQVELTIRFPGEVFLTAMRIHSEHSGKYHRAEGVTIEAESGGRYGQVLTERLTDADAEVSFTQTSAQTWRLTFQTGDSGKICLRGLEYFCGEQQLFPPRVPEDWPDRLGIERPPLTRQ